MSKLKCVTRNHISLMLSMYQFFCFCCILLIKMMPYFVVFYHEKRLLFACLKMFTQLYICRLRLWLDLARFLVVLTWKLAFFLRVWMILILLIKLLTKCDVFFLLNFILPELNKYCTRKSQQIIFWWWPVGMLDFKKT